MIKESDMVVLALSLPRCSKCILPNTFPTIRLDNKGVCNFCKTFRRPKYLGEQALKKTIYPLVGKQKYDCIVPLSGGRDSTYVLYLAKVKLGLNVLAVNYDNEFRETQAYKNMMEACCRLDVELISERSRKNLASKCVKYAILSSAGLEDLGVCNACEYGYRSVVYRYASALKIPLIFWGESSLETTMDSPLDFFGSIGWPRKILKLLNPNYYLYQYYLFLHRLEFSGLRLAISSRSYPNPCPRTTLELKVFDYVPWDRQEIKSTIMTTLGWRKPEGKISTWRTDCSIHDLVNYSFLGKYGCTKDCVGYSKMIRAQQMTREEALSQEEQAIQKLTNNVIQILERLGLSTKHRERFFKML